MCILSSLYTSCFFHFKVNRTNIENRNCYKLANSHTVILIPVLLTPCFSKVFHLFNSEIKMNSVPSGTSNLVTGQVAKNPAMSNPVPQPAILARPGVSRSGVLPGKIWFYKIKLLWTLSPWNLKFCLPWGIVPWPRHPPEMCNFPERTVITVSGQLTERPLSITNKMAAKQAHVFSACTVVACARFLGLWAFTGIFRFTVFCTGDITGRLKNLTLSRTIYISCCNVFVRSRYS